MQLQNDNQFKILLERKLENLSLYKQVYRAGWQSPTHAHENARFVFVLKGSFNERYGRRERICSPFTSIFRPPQEEHSEIYHDNGVVCLSVDVSSRWMEHLKHHRVRLEDSKDFRSVKLTPLIIKLNDEFDFKDDVSALAIEALLLELAVEIYRQTASESKSARWLKRAEEFIHEHSSSNLTLNEIATVAGVHPVHLARTFRQKHQCTIAEYLRRLRVESACLLLASSNLSLAEIATQTGFSDQSHFSKIFKRVTKMTPAQYRTNFRPFHS